MAVVLDASAIIAFLRNEPGADVVDQYLLREQGSAFAHAVNLCEVYYDFWRASDQETAESAITDLFVLGVKERNDMDPVFWRAAGRLKAIYRRLSLADCCALALADRLDAPLISADRHELERLASSSHRIAFIR